MRASFLLLIALAICAAASESNHPLPERLSANEQSHPIDLGSPLHNTAAAAAAPSADCAERPYCHAALLAANWIVSVAQPAPNGVGIFWPPALIGQDADAPYNRTFDLYSGVAGVLVFLLEAHTAGGDAAHLDAAVAAGAYLASAADAVVFSLSSTGLYHGGVAGMAFAVSTLDVYTNGTHPELARAYQTFVDYLFLSAHAAPGGGQSVNALTGLRWGDAGVGLFLLQQQSVLVDPNARAPLLKLAAAIGTYLISAGVRTRDGGLMWTSGFGSLEMPNYAEGTSGIGYFLGALANATGDRTFTDAALAAGHYLVSIANRTGGRCLIYHDNATQGLYYLSNCNGPPGTGRFFLLLHALTGDALWNELALESGRAVQELSPFVGGGNGHDSAGAFNFYVDFASPVQPPPFWNNVGLCDGGAAAVLYFLTLHARDPASPARPLDFARAVADDILRRADSDSPAGQLRWSITEWRTDPRRSFGAQVGYMQGAAGVGSTMLAVDAAVNALPSPRVRLPDDFEQVAAAGRWAQK
jgi:hypothetical protein